MKYILKYTTKCALNLHNHMKTCAQEVRKSIFDIYRYDRLKFSNFVNKQTKHDSRMKLFRWMNTASRNHMKYKNW